MKKNDFGQIKALDIKELRAKAQAIKAEMPDLILDKNMNKLKDFKKISKKRKDLAQILTVVRQKELLSELETKVTKSEVAEVEKGGSKEVKTQKLKVKNQVTSR